MKLHEFKALLQANREKQFRLQLPDARTVPVSFHITEVGFVSKTFIDCGGKMHSVQTCQLQVWLGSDSEHRLEAGKMADILQVAQKVVTSSDLDVEIEYEDQIISQYPVRDAEISADAVTLLLTTKHTDCLAKEFCLTPANRSSDSSSCGCSSSACCN